MLKIFENRMKLKKALNQEKDYLRDGYLTQIHQFLKHLPEQVLTLLQ